MQLKEMDNVHTLNDAFNDSGGADLDGALSMRHLIGIFFCFVCLFVIVLHCLLLVVISFLVARRCRVYTFCLPSSTSHMFDIKTDRQ